MKLTITKMKLNHVKMRSNILTWFSFILVHFDQATSDRNICKMYPYLYKILNMQKMLGLQLMGYIYTSKNLIERLTLGGMLVISK